VRAFDDPVRIKRGDGLKMQPRSADRSLAPIILGLSRAGIIERERINVRRGCGAQRAL